MLISKSNQKKLSKKRGLPFPFILIKGWLSPLFATSATAIILMSAAAAQPPALPPGLELDGGPSLPEGLEDDAALALPPGLESAQEETEKTPARDKFPIHGFWETRLGVRTQPDYAQPDDASIAETRLQLEFEKSIGKATLDFAGDFYLDAVLEEAEFDLRRLKVSASISKSIDLSLGRQVLTWGTGDLLFINDLFPKDWQSFFIGRDVEYLKAPSNAVRIGWFHKVLNIDFAYTPKFASDRFINGERISYWAPSLDMHGGYWNQVNTSRPDDYFDDDEFALRLYRNIGSYEVALYGYSGYWKSPAGEDPGTTEATFPKLRVYGASLRGKVGKGIGNIEAGYYDSYQDRGDDDPFVGNSEFRMLAGYEQELAKEFTGAVQYYLEHIVDYDQYKSTLSEGTPRRDRDRHVVTLRLTKLMMNQNMTLSLFTYFSPSDGDAFLRPKVTYKAGDHWTFESGANIFSGESDTTFFGQFENNTNVYASARYSF